MAAPIRESGGPLVRAWAFLRELSGDDCYERYLAHHRENHHGEAAQSRREFFALRQDRKWNGITRCC